jgi:phage virion morphogenesis protein
MSEKGVSINWGGLDKAVEGAASKLADTKKLMTTIGAAMKNQTIARFRKSEGPDGEAWKPSARAKRENGKTLLNTGRLGGGKDSLSMSVTPAEVHVGSNVVYSRIHQLGGKAGRGHKVNIPARPYLGINEEDREEIADLIREHIEGAFKK